MKTIDATTFAALFAAIAIVEAVQPGRLLSLHRGEPDFLKTEDWRGREIRLLIAPAFAALVERQPSDDDLFSPDQLTELAEQAYAEARIHLYGRTA